MFISAQLTSEVFNEIQGNQVSDLKTFLIVALILTNFTIIE